MCLHFEFKSEIMKRRGHKGDLCVNGDDNRVDFEKIRSGDVE
jgi:hypothetical protein